jgi:hypothetical protein
MKIILTKLIGLGIPQQTPEGPQQAGFAPGVFADEHSGVVQPEERRFIPRKPLTSMRSRNMRPYPVHPDGAIVAKLPEKSYRVTAFSAGTVRNERFGRRRLGGAIEGHSSG